MQSMNKKIKLLFFILCLIVMAALSGCAKNADSEVQGSDTAVAITNPRQLVAADNKTARTIMWEAKVKQPYTLEYRLKGSKDIRQCRQQTVALRIRTVLFNIPHV